MCEQQGALHCFPSLEEIHYREDHPAMDAGWHRARLTSRARAALLALMLVEKSLTVSGRWDRRSGRWDRQSAGGTGSLGGGTGGPQMTVLLPLAPGAAQDAPSRPEQGLVLSLSLSPKIYPETLLIPKCTELSTRAEVSGDVAGFWQDIEKQ